MSARVLLNLKTSRGKYINARLAEHFIFLFATSLINSVIQEHENRFY